MESSGRFHLSMRWNRSCVSHNSWLLDEHKSEEYGEGINEVIDSMFGVDRLFSVMHELPVIVVWLIISSGF